MNTKLASMVAALGLGLGGCATDPGMGGMVYRDGGYYAPAREGYGDYYVAPDYSDDWAYDGFYDPFYGPFYDPFVFGPNWYGGGGGYCPARYRYCPAGWYDGFGSGYYGGGFGGTGFWLGFGGRGGYYDPWGYREQPYAWRPPQHRRLPPTQGTQSPAPQPPGGADGGLANAGGGDAYAPGTAADGRFEDGIGDVRPDERPRRRLLRQQPTWAPLPLGSRPAPPNPSWPDHSDHSDRSGRGSDGGGRSSGGGERSERSERSDGGGRGSASEDSSDTPRTRRRDRGG